MFLLGIALMPPDRCQAHCNSPKEPRLMVQFQRNSGSHHELRNNHSDRDSTGKDCQKDTDEHDCTTHFYEKEVSVKRLLPVFPTRALQDSRGNDHSTTIIVTSETLPYRNLASSQLTTEDKVLEIGCSTGEASAVMIQYCQAWVGFDTSPDMVHSCHSRIARQPLKNAKSISVFQVDALVDPIRAEQLVRQSLDGNTPDTVFIDIGGNRECEGVWSMLAWAMLMKPSLIVIKSRDLADQLQQEHNRNSGVADTVLTRSSTTPIVVGSTWMETHLWQCTNRRMHSLPSHPMQAPLRHVPHTETPICRYHNYHKDGCLRYKNVSNSCPLDHDHCHKCLLRGHVALSCTLVSSIESHGGIPNRSEAL